MAELPPVVFDVYLVPRGTLTPDWTPLEGAMCIGKVTVDPAQVPEGAEPIDRAIELIATQTPRVY